MKLLLSLALAAALAFAGCAAKGSDETTTGAADGSTSSNGTTNLGTTSGSVAPTSGSASGSAANRAPAISAFTTNLTVGGVTSVLAGKAVKFTFNATDADTDNLTFRLVFGDQTTNATGKLPTKGVNHTYAAAGNFTAKVFVSDGKFIVNKTLQVNVTVPATTGGGKTPVVFSGEVDPTCWVLFDLAFDIPATLAGGAYTLTPAEVEVNWWIGEGQTDPIEGGGNSGTVPAGTTSAHICWDGIDPIIGVGAAPEAVTATLTITPV